MSASAAPGRAQGEVVKGRLRCVPNAKNRRDLDISITFSLEGVRSTGETTHHYRMR